MNIQPHHTWAAILIRNRYEPPKLREYSRGLQHAVSFIFSTRQDRNAIADEIRRMRKEKRQAKAAA